VHTLNFVYNNFIYADKPYITLIKLNKLWPRVQEQRNIITNEFTQINIILNNECNIDVAKSIIFNKII